jgi:hypothetical protein
VVKGARQTQKAAACAPLERYGECIASCISDGGSAEARGGRSDSALTASKCNRNKQKRTHELLRSHASTECSRMQPKKRKNLASEIKARS